MCALHAGRLGSPALSTAGVAPAKKFYQKELLIQFNQLLKNVINLISCWKMPCVLITNQE